VRIDVYDYTALDYVLDWVVKLTTSENINIQYHKTTPRKITEKEMELQIEEKVASPEPSFLEDNPWIEILAERGKD